MKLIWLVMKSSLSIGKQGFTLIELSIVMVIIALLVAGISIAEEFTVRAKLNSIAEDFQKFQMAYMGFHNRYRAVPGDMVNASSYWPSLSECAVTPGNCDGNRNGFVEYDVANEMHAAWKQLSLAGLVDAAIEVVPDDYVGQAIGVNVYPSKIRAAGYVIFSERISQYVNYDNPFFNSFRPTVQTNAVFLAKSDQIADANGTWGSGNPYDVPEFDLGAISVDDAFNLDRKLDDGAWDAAGNAVGAYSGNIRVYGVDITNLEECIINHSDVAANIYNLSATRDCIIGRALN